MELERPAQDALWLFWHGLTTEPLAAVRQFTQNPLQVAHSTDPLAVALSACAAVSASVFVLGAATGNYSKVRDTGCMVMRGFLLVKSIYVLGRLNARVDHLPRCCFGPDVRVQVLLP